MKENKNIKVIVQSVSNNLENYMNYIGAFARDKTMQVNLVTDSPEVNNPVPMDSFGKKSPYSVKHLENKLIENNKQGLINCAEGLNQKGVSVNASIEIGDLKDGLAPDRGDDTTLLWTLRQSSEDSFINRILGTDETQIAKTSSQPTLVVPDIVTYNTPRTLLMVVDNMRDVDVIGVRKVVEAIDMEVVYIINEEIPDYKVHEFLQTMNRSFSKTKNEVYRMSLNDLEARLVDIVEQRKPQWLGFLNFEKSLVERLYVANANKFILSTELPLLIA